MSAWTPDLTRASKFLSLVLRHQPDAAGVELDGNGWVSIESLLSAPSAIRLGLTRERLEVIVETNPKKRFAIDATGAKIRAVQGHSVDIDLAYSVADPPAVLFHGTHPRP